MTDPLATLFHDEVHRLDVPPPATDAVMARGRNVRRLRRTTRAVVGAVAAVALVGAVTAAIGTSRHDVVEPARLPDDAAYQQLGAWAAGDEVHVGNHMVFVPGAEDVQYTSVGALVFSHGVHAPGYPQVDARATLVRPDGTTQQVTDPGIADLEFEGPATDPASPFIAYVRPIGSAADRMSELVVIDLGTGEEQVVGEPWRSSGRGQDVARGISGDEVAYFHHGRFRQVNWRTGEEVTRAHQGFVTLSSVGMDAYVTSDHSGWQVRSSDGGKILLEVPYGGEGAWDAVSLSLDGRWLAVETTGGFRVYEVSSGDHVDFAGDRDVDDYGWTPDGHLVGKKYRSQPSEVEVCDPADGQCVGSGRTVRRDLTLVAGASGFGSP